MSPLTPPGSGGGRCFGERSGVPTTLGSTWARSRFRPARLLRIDARDERPRRLRNRFLADVAELAFDRRPERGPRSDRGERPHVRGAGPPPRDGPAVGPPLPRVAWVPAPGAPRADRARPRAPPPARAGPGLVPDRPGTAREPPPYPRPGSVAAPATCS